MKPVDAVDDWWIERCRREVRMMTKLGPFSVYDPSKVFTCRSWDAQSASLFLRPSAPRTILLLGLGGGTVARQCRALFPEASICAVEKDARVIEIAGRDFGLGSCGIHVIQDSAENFLRTTLRRFDAVVDDAWPLREGAWRSAWHDDGWPSRWRTKLNPGGLLAVNLYARGEDSAVHRRVRAALRHSFQHVCEVSLPGRLTTVLAAGDELRDRRETSRILRESLMCLFGEVTAMRFRTC